MTLLELLITVSLIGLIATVLSTAVIVTLRQQDNTEGRLNVARAEQTVGLWMPADLASASDVDTDPQASPCGAVTCGDIDLSAGSNVVMLSWIGSGGVQTNVSYHFTPSGDGRTYELWRVECTGGPGAWSCTSRTVLDELPGPPAGEPFVPGVVNGDACTRDVDPVPCTRPDWVIIVSEPLAPDAITDDEIATESDDERKDANRVIVSINGGGDAPGAGGGINQISITAGGTIRSEIDANSVQGAPSFVEARSRCGGPMTLVVDESNSIGTAIGDVREGVRDFITALAGTPVQLQVVRFQTFSSILGSTEWHDYFDMSDQADVDALLASVDNLSGSWSGGNRGGTNWEEALFRTFFAADGSTSAVIPETVVFFTDGVPTYDRLVYKTDPGVIPAKPEAPSAAWPESTGSRYSQIGFNRADYIANQFRRGVRLIGVGVGSGIEQYSNWIASPGAGYVETVERGSYSYVEDVYEYYGLYQVYDGDWRYVDLATYGNWSGSKRIRNGWTEISQAQYELADTTTADDSNDGLLKDYEDTRKISTAAYNANATNPNYRSVAKTWSNGPDWEPWFGAQTGSSSHYRTTKEYGTAGPYDGYDDPTEASTRNDLILARLISGNDFGTPAIWDGTSYTNSEIADMYVLPEWDQFGTAMETVALGECGGTLTLQTNLGDGSPADDPFRYQNSAVLDSTETPVEIEQTVVTTDQQYVTGTFDFAVQNGQFVTVEILPQNFSELGSYSPVGWSCRAGNAVRSFETVAIDGVSGWTGIRVEVAANEAVSCQLEVSG